MKDKIISCVLWMLVWWIIVYGYGLMNNDWTQKNQNLKGWFDRTTSASGSMSTEQISTISKRTGISEDVIKTRLESGETMRDIMWWAGNTNAWWERGSRQRPE